MTMMPFKLSIQPAPVQFLLTVRGPLAAKDIEAGRVAHNQAAGTDEGVALARSFGDLSHAVYVPAGPDAQSNKLLFIDYWNSIDGLLTFFSDKQVQGAWLPLTEGEGTWQHVRIRMPSGLHVTMRTSRLEKVR